MRLMDIVWSESLNKTSGSTLLGSSILPSSVYLPASLSRPKFENEEALLDKIDQYLISKFAAYPWNYVVIEEEDNEFDAELTYVRHLPDGTRKVWK